MPVLAAVTELQTGGLETQTLTSHTLGWEFLSWSIGSCVLREERDKGALLSSSIITPSNLMTTPPPKTPDAITLGRFQHMNLLKFTQSMAPGLLFVVLNALWKVWLSCCPCSVPGDWV